ncbi:guanylate cyclase domain-containing protein, partial [Haematococcus lacustris]
GKVMNRAARVCSRCLPGQVLATGLVWEYSAQQGGLQAAGVRGDALGPAEMKGVPGLIELVHCYLGPPDCPAR